MTTAIDSRRTGADPARLSALAQHLRASAILRIAAEVRTHIAAGKAIANLTVGDFSSAQFPIPKLLEQATIAALEAGESTYPPPNGIESLRVAVRDFYARRLAWQVPLESVLVGSGARPLIYALFRAVVDAGDRVVFTVPSWNNDAYCELVGAQVTEVECDASTGFLPTAKALRPALRGARLLALNSPLNPTGTLFDADMLGDICDAVIEENARRGAGDGERPLYLMYDQVYWMLTAAGLKHVHPVEVRPAVAPYVVTVDAISKAFAATGLRVGWSVGPADVIRAMNDIVGHVGAWAPRPEQVATAKFLAADAAVDAHVALMRREIFARLDPLYEGFEAMRRDGLPVECIRPQGTIYLSGRFAVHGRRTPAGDVIERDEDIRRYLLDAAGLAAVPFSAFGTHTDDGWFRLSIGVITPAQIAELLPRLRKALAELR